MTITKTEIEDVLIIEPKVFGDNRGWFTESYSKVKLQEFGLDIEFIQDNHSMSSQKGTLRGLHFQTNPKAQTKLVRCTIGRILDVAVDLRKGSSTYKKWVAVELSADNKKELLVPKGFAHGFVTLTDNAEVQYKVDEYYSPQCDRSIRFDDPNIGVDWNFINPVLSEKDSKAPFLKDCDINFSVKVLVTGANGQLGYDMLKKLNEVGIETIASTREDFDLTDYDSTNAYIKSCKPDIIIHCAAYTAVDKAEDEKEKCYKVNVEGTRNIALAAKDIDSKVVYISTDYVFDGKDEAPYKEDESTNPVNYYGYTKAQGEKIIQDLLEKYYIVRTSWVFGANGNNFVKTMLRLSESRDELSVVSDQIGSPTYTKDLADFIFDLIQTDNYGIYHGVNEGYCNWSEFAEEIFSIAGKKVKVHPIKSIEYPTKASRPYNSRLSKKRMDSAGLKRLPDWKDALNRFLSEII